MNIHALDSFEERSAKQRVRDAERELAVVRAAKWNPQGGGQNVLWSAHSGRNDGYGSTAEDIFASWEYDTFEEQNPRPSASTSAERLLWENAYVAHVNRFAPPFVNGSSELQWGGVSAETVREWFADDPTSPVIGDHLTESSLDEHHEDACDCIVEAAELQTILDVWQPHAGTRDVGDLALEDALAAWNAKQTIRSYYPDTGVLIPRLSTSTHEEAVAWCVRQMSEAESDFASAFGRSSSP